MAAANAIHPMDVQETSSHTLMPSSTPSPPSMTTATTKSTTIMTNNYEIYNDDDHANSEDDDRILKSQNSNDSSKTDSISGSGSSSDVILGSNEVGDNGVDNNFSSQKIIENQDVEETDSAAVDHASLQSDASSTTEQCNINENGPQNNDNCNTDDDIFKTNSGLPSQKNDDSIVTLQTPQISLDSELHRQRRPSRTSHHRRYSHTSHLSRLTPLLHNPNHHNSLHTNNSTTAAKPKSRPFNCLTWSSSRIRLAILGCLTSSLVLSIRLYFAYKPTAYLIHSIVVFADMVLIHLFTNCKWLSVSGEITTMLFAVLYTITKQTVFELMETTMIAVLCSFHMMGSRKRHREGEGRLLEDLTGLQVEVGEYLVLAQRDGLLSQHEEQDNGQSPFRGNGSFAASSRMSQILMHTLSSMDLDQEEWHSQHTVRFQEGGEGWGNNGKDEEREEQKELTLEMTLEQGEMTATTMVAPLTGSKTQARIGCDDNIYNSTCKYCGRRRSRPDLHVEFADMDVEISSFHRSSPSSNDLVISPTPMISTPSTKADNHNGGRNVSMIAVAGGARATNFNNCDDSDDDGNENHNDALHLATKTDAATAPTAKTSRFALFFEHFLDGSAGVMYTSFLGLIIDEFIHYESDSSKSAY